MKKIISCLIIGILLVSIVLGENHFNELSGQDLAAEIEQGNVDLSQLKPAKLNEALNLNPSLWWIRPDVEDAVDEKLSSEPSFLTGENIDRWFYVKGKFLGVTGTTIVNYNKEIGEVTLSNTNLKISNLDSGLYQRARIENGKIIFPDQTMVRGDATISSDGETLNIRGGTLTVTQMNVEGVTQMNVKGTYTVTGGIAEIDGVEYTADGPMRVEPGVIGPVLSSLTIETIDASGGLQDEPSKITGMRDGLVVDKFIGSVEFGNRYKIIKPGTIYNPHTADGQSLATIQPVEILNYVPTGGNRGACLNACILEEGLELHARANTEVIITVLETDKMNYFQSNPLVNGKIVLRSINDDEGSGVFTLTGSQSTISGSFPNINIKAYFDENGKNQEFFYDAPNNDIFSIDPARSPEYFPPTPPGEIPPGEMQEVGDTYVAQAAEPQAQKYTVQPGDSLLKIARDLRERGYSVTAEQLKEANKDKYPSLENNPDHIEIGWSLDIPGAPVIDDILEAAKTNLPGTADLTGANAKSFNVRSCPDTSCFRKDLIELATYQIGGVYPNNKNEVWAYLPEQDGWIYIDGVIKRGKLDCGEDCNLDFDAVPDSTLPAVVSIVELPPPSEGLTLPIAQNLPQIESAAQGAELTPVALVIPPQVEDLSYEIPVSLYNRISSTFGEPREGYLHGGIDFAAPRGTTIYAVEGGKVIFAGDMGTYGNVVQILHTDGTSTLYAHADSIEDHIESGRPVKQGEPIAKVGSTGRSTGDHLHFEYRDEKGEPINPELILGPLPVSYQQS